MQKAQCKRGLALRLAAARSGLAAVLLAPLLLAAAITAQQGAADGEWRRIGGDAGSTRYSPLEQITAQNVKALRIAWTWRGDNFGSVVSSDATGESDGEPGVDGSEISEMAPGAQHRPVDPGQAPAQAGAPGDVAGLDQATETPAAAHVPDDTGAPEGRSTAPATPAAPPSTVPETGGRPDAPGGQAARD